VPQGNAQRGQGVEILAQGLWQAHHQREPPITFKHQTRLPSSHGNRHHILHVRYAQPIPGNSRAVNEDTQDGQACCLFDFDVRCPRNTLGARSQGSNPWQTQVLALGIPLPEYFPLDPVA
jgi:hypothetical protein